MRRVLITTVIFMVSLTCARAVEALDSDRAVVWGVTAGSPQLLALTLETHQNRSLRFQASLSTVVLASSLTGRVLLTRISGSARPYGFVGGGLFNVGEGDGGGARGTTGLVWSGGGLSVPIRSLRLFAEIGIMGGLDKDKGFESPLPTVAVGILFAR
jgi:hypothetical protein